MSNESLVALSDEEVRAVCTRVTSAALAGQYDTPIDHLTVPRGDLRQPWHLPARLVRLIRESDHLGKPQTVEALCKRDELDLIKTKGIGKIGVLKVREALHWLGCGRFRMHGRSGPYIFSPKLRRCFPLGVSLHDEDDWREVHIFKSGPRHGHFKPSDLRRKHRKDLRRHGVVA